MIPAEAAATAGNPQDSTEKPMEIEELPEGPAKGSIRDSRLAKC